MPVLNIAACLDATLEQLDEKIVEASNELEWMKQLREQKMRASVMNQVAQIPPELTDSVLDIAAQQHSPIEVQNENYDWVLVAARMVIGESSSGQQLLNPMVDALLRNTTLRMSRNYLQRVTDTVNGTPVLRGNLLKARHVVIRVNLRCSPNLQLAQQQQRNAFQATVDLIQALTVTQRAQVCPQLKSIGVIASVAVGGNNPNMAFTDMEMVFDPTTAPDGMLLRPVLQHIISALKLQVQVLTLNSSFQLQVRCFWGNNDQYAIWEGKKMAVDEKSVDEILKEAQKDPQHLHG